MQAVVVESILWQGLQGGAVFNARTADGIRHRIVAAANIMPRPPVAGEVWAIDGVIRRHPAYGPQVEAQHAALQKPSGRLIVQTIAGSPAFPGLGAARAAALWEEFGERLYEMLAAGAPAPFEELLGPALARVLVAGWQSLEAEAAAYQWLDAHGLPVWLAKKLLTIYGRHLVEKLEENPYRLLAFTSWTQADRVGRAMGIAIDDPRRLVAAAEATGYQRLSLAHTWTPWEDFIVATARLLGSDQKRAEKAVNLAQEAFAVVRVGEGAQGLGPLSMEQFIASRIMAMAAGEEGAVQMTLRQQPTAEQLDHLFARFDPQSGLRLNTAQREAVRLAVTSPVACITGGAGVGKTTVLRAVHMAAEVLGFGGVHQMALSGRAAKRMAEATGRPASTIAAFLQAVDARKISLDQEPLVVVDEASMLDLPHCYRILRRLPPGARLLLVGDAAQLPPIGFGLTFHALVGHPKLPTVELTEIHRQAAATGIPQVSVGIRRGEIPLLTEYQGIGAGVSFIAAEPGQIAGRLQEVARDLGGVGCCQVIGAVKSGPAGVRTVNQAFHELGAAGRPERHGFAEGEPVLWTVNDYERGLLNGSLGVVRSVGEGLRVEFDGVEQLIEEGDVRNLEHAYAITVHKAQGSQFERVVVPVFSSRLLDRTLLYTAVTRAVQQVVFVGDRAAFERAVVEAPLPSRRQTGMAIHLGATDGIP